MSRHTIATIVRAVAVFAGSRHVLASETLSTGEENMPQQLRTGGGGTNPAADHEPHLEATLTPTPTTELSRNPKSKLRRPITRLLPAGLDRIQLSDTQCEYGQTDSHQDDHNEVCSHDDGDHSSWNTDGQETKSLDTAQQHESKSGLWPWTQSTSSKPFPPQAAASIEMSFIRPRHNSSESTDVRKGYGSNSEEESSSKGLCESSDKSTPDTIRPKISSEPRKSRIRQLAFFENFWSKEDKPTFGDNLRQPLMDDDRLGNANL